jgi:UDP-N-acetylglucosamine 4,6-dehydratase
MYYYSRICEIFKEVVILFNDRSILITGGTGSFGQAYVKTLLERYKVKRIVVYSRDEQKQAEMQYHFASPLIEFYLGDVRDLQRLQEVMYGIDYVIHTAAIKNVPFAEHNPMECIKTNIYGSENVIRAAIDNRVEKVMLLSSDKAANPSNLYGASKLAADKLFVAANNLIRNEKTKLAVTRYGNVVGTRGSVVPFFRKLIEGNAQELPITDSRMTRYWITLQQGVDFVLKNFSRMQGGEIFVPKLPSVRITDLAAAMAPHIPTKIVGMRPGEKVHEIMCPQDDAHLTLEFPDHFVIKPSAIYSDQIHYETNKLDEKGVAVAQDFQYDSSNNPNFLTIEQIREMNRMKL